MNAMNEKVFAAHAALAIERAVALGAKASWSTAKHLDALAEALKANPDAIRETLSECYNVSGHQQFLAKRFLKYGHFQRSEKRSVPEQADDLYAELVKGLEG